MKSIGLIPLIKQQTALIKYIRKQEGVLDYVAYDPYDKSCYYCIPRGVKVACDMATLSKLQAHAKRYYPYMSVIPMTVAEYISHTNRPHIN